MTTYEEDIVDWEDNITFEKVKLVTRDTIVSLAIGGILGFGTALLLLLLK